MIYVTTLFYQVPNTVLDEIFYLMVTFRFQDVAGSLEACLTLPLALSSEGGLCETQDSGLHPPFKLEVFATLERCMRKCWSDGIFIPVLIHRFWKLTIQVILNLSCDR